MSLAEASTLYMNAARNICASLLLGASLLCLTSWAEEELTPEQRVLVENFHRPVSTLGEAMNTARTALKGISDTAGADAAAPAVSAVIRAEKEVSEAAARLTEAGLNVSSLYKKGQLAKAISSLPIAAYNADIQATLANGCCGSVKLYLTITGTSATDEQLHNTLNEQNKADLAAVEHALSAIEPICPVSHWRPLEDEFVKRFDASVPAAERLQQRPLTAMLLHSLLEKHSKWIFELANQEFHHNGDMEERFLLRPQNYIGRWYERRSFDDYFYRCADALDLNSATPRGKAIWEAAAPRLAELRKKYNLGTGDGRTRETAFDIPAEIKPGEFKRFVNEVTQELFGERALHSNLRWSSLGKNGRRVVHGIILVGRPGNRNRNNDSHTIMPCYFNIEQK